MESFSLRLCHLLHCRGAGWKMVYHILKHDPELKELYSPTFLYQFPELPSSIIQTLFEDLHSPVLLEQIRHYQQNDIKIITYFDSAYPELLKETYQPPWVLYAKGDISLLGKQTKLAVVGSRQATEYGKRAIDRLFPPLIEKGIIIVSGLALGVDTLAHEAAIRLGGKTIAVIAGGIYHIYPQTNQKLALNIMKHYLVISEYPPNTTPSRWQFPMRNRIISGVSKGTFIIEAKRKSGSLITANFAVHEGREVFALPGNIFSQHSTGTNDLIQQGAKLVRSHEDILNELFYA
ncbi:DNA-processing protein DprA [Robertmurraya beringensis]|uniref:DNA-processing protein DprA n=1 Tax=Robertmurraya beringensis TaxID=641660 RepID=A0ABV6KN47_9BACI